MNFDSIVSWLVDFYHSYTVIAVIFIVIVAVITIIKPKSMFKFYLFVLFAAATFYVLSYLAESLFTGAESKKFLSTKSMKSID